jgi:hypothetical protein
MEADHRVTLRQIGSTTLASVGARDYVHDDGNGMVMFRVGGSRSVRKVIVTLAGDDTYIVEVGHLPTHGAHAFEWVTDRTDNGVYAEQLAATVRRLVDGSDE